MLVKHFAIFDEIENMSQDEHNAVQGYLNLVKSATSFQSMVTATNCDPAAFFELKEEVEAGQLFVGPSYTKFELVLAGRQASTRGDAGAMLLLCTKAGSAMQTLAKSGMEVSDLAKTADGIFLDSVLEVVGKLSVAEVPKTVQDCETKQTLVAIYKNMNSFAGNDGFLVPENTILDMRKFHIFTDPHGVPVVDLASGLEYIKSRRSEDTEDATKIKFKVKFKAFEV